jgi:hypothetical protein
MGKDAANQLGKLIDEAWVYHADESERLTLELEAAELGAAAPSLIEPFLVLATHTIGEHLGDWRRAWHWANAHSMGASPLRKREKHGACSTSPPSLPVNR